MPDVAQTGNNPGNPQNNNRLDGYTYDAAGNLLSDKTHTYAYDAENRITQVDAGATATYSYDADSRRAVKTTGTAIYNECDPSNTTGGTVYYLYDQTGHADVYTANGVNGCKDEIYAGARHLATYEGRTTFIHTDWLGTDRVHIAYPSANNRSLDQHCTSLPFGDGASGCVATPYTSPLFFTGKERDTESGNDYFGARYYASTMGRFLSPDWSAKVQPVPYAKLDDPQSLNLYSYVRNNPLSKVDKDGHCSSPSVGKGQVGVCIDLYIQAKTINLVGQGDGRGPAANDPKATYRVELQLVMDPKGGTVSLVKDDAGVS